MWERPPGRESHLVEAAAAPRVRLQRGSYYEVVAALGESIFENNSHLH